MPLAANVIEELLLSHFPTGTWLKGMRIVVDCANGAMSEVAPELLKRLGADVDVICASPNGKEHQCKCGAVHLESLAEAMKKRLMPILESRLMATAIVRFLFPAAGGRWMAMRCCW